MGVFMSSKLQEFNQVELQLKELMSKMEQMKHDEEIAKAREFQDKLSKLVNDSQLSATEVVFVVNELFGAANVRKVLDQLTGEAGGRSGSRSSTRKPNKMKCWKNEVTGETYTGKKMSKQVAQWKEEHGDEKVTVTEVEE